MIVSEGHDLGPAPLRIRNEINLHPLVFITDAAHLMMKGMVSVGVIPIKGRGYFVVPPINGFNRVLDQGEFQLESAAPVTQVDRGDVGMVPTAVLCRVERAVVNVEVPVEIQDIDVVMGKGEFH
jgi:hypothetical protein